MNQINQEGIIGRGVLSLFVISGVVFSGITFFMLDDGMQNIFSENEVKSVPTDICENGLCFIENSEGVSNKNLVKARGLKYFIKNRTPSKLSSNSIPYISSNIEYYLDILIQYANYDLENENRIRKLNGLKV